MYFISHQVQRSMTQYSFHKAAEHRVEMEITKYALFGLQK